MEEIKKIHKVYLEILDRCAEYEVVDRLPLPPIPLKAEVEKSNEAQSRILLKDDQLRDLYIEKLYYPPPIDDLINIRYIQFDYPINNKLYWEKIRNFIEDKNDYKYLNQCRQKFGLINPKRQINNSQLKIKYYGPIGTTGYAAVCRQIVDGLSTIANVEFHNIQFQSFSLDNENDNEDLRIYGNQCCKNIGDTYDVLVLHSTPELWPTYIRKEKGKFDLSYGITVWETDKIPYSWKDHLKCVDIISTPSKFSAEAFKKSFNNVEIIHHPVFVKKNEIHRDDKMIQWKEEHKFIFYCISEWSNRKGIAELIKAFRQFIDLDITDSYRLYIKSCGDIGHDEANVFIDNLDFPNSSKPYLNYNYISEAQIAGIHFDGDCYISLAKSEGHGLGICHAALLGKKCIITDYGGQCEYLDKEAALFIKVKKLEPATHCSTWSKKHENCKNLVYCRFFNLFRPNEQQWALPDINHAVELMQQVTIKNFSFHENHWKKFSIENVGNEFLKSFKKHLKENCMKSFTSEYIESKTISLDDCKPQAMLFDWPKKKLKKIVCINSYGFGNVGDTMYSIILSKFFSKDRGYEIVFYSDNCTHLGPININKFTQDNPPKFDILIIGGGGLFNSIRANHKITSMMWWLDKAKTYNAKLYIISTGFQNCEIDSGIQKWMYFFKPLFEYASLISMRSFDDVNFCRMIVSPKHAYKIEYHPDLAYSEQIQIKDDLNRNILLVILTNFITLEDETIRKKIKQIAIDKKVELLFMNWEGTCKERDTFNETNDQLIKQFFPGSVFYKGLQLDFEMDQVFKILSKTQIIITGRYHGVVLGRVMRVPEIITFRYGNYKFIADNRSHHDIISLETLSDLAIRPLIKIDEGFCGYERENWTEDDRNSKISNTCDYENLSPRIIQSRPNFFL